ncbi:hypothetical protein [Deinococcus hopiensis]|uniref:hypothetical protein n=1 Tax=Deinococcus hopiensis TaxID=309885 RepID=UPI00111C06B9|nr:hypothetical protein [Deinococcus hopiensis]
MKVTGLNGWIFVGEHVINPRAVTRLQLRRNPFNRNPGESVDEWSYSVEIHLGADIVALQMKNEDGSVATDAKVAHSFIADIVGMATWQQLEK